MVPTLSHFLAVAALLFAAGLFTVLTRRNAVAILMGVELMLNAANVNLVAFNRFVVVLAAAEAAVGLAIVLSIFHTFKTIDVRAADLMRE